MYQEKNYGCDPSEYISQKWAFSMVDKCMVLEDDDVPSQSFFPFCKEMLDKYEHDQRISMISGFNIDEVTSDCPYDYFFTSTFAIWGWASWRRVIDQWDGQYSFLDDDYNMAQLRALAEQRKYRKDMIKMFYNHRATGKEYYESIFWASMLFNSGLAILPSKNQINNLGLMADSTHFTASAKTTPKRFLKIFTMKLFDIIDICISFIYTILRSLLEIFKSFITISSCRKKSIIVESSKIERNSLMTKSLSIFVPLKSLCIVLSLLIKYISYKESKIRIFCSFKKLFSIADCFFNITIR
jgi:hypothetical protein